MKYSYDHQKKDGAKQETALVTGASSGIGEAFARLLAKEGYNLVLVARNEQRLSELKQKLENEINGIQVTILAKDLTLPEAPGEIYADLGKRHITIDLLVNNAGFGEYGKFSELSLEPQLNTIALNITALTALTRILLPSMLQKRNGKILNVASTAAFQPGPLMAVYYATKAYVLSLSEALSYELKNDGVTVTALCPGPTKTEFFSKRPEMKQLRLLQNIKLMSAETVANIGYRALMAGKPVVIPGFTNAFLAFMVRFSPRRLTTAISGWTLKKS